jgi:hypothetical protein
MDNFWLIQYILDEEEKRNKDEDVSYSLYTTHTDSKVDSWFEKHPFIERWYPIVLGILIGLIPLFVPLIIYELFMV